MREPGKGGHIIFHTYKEKVDWNVATANNDPMIKQCKIPKILDSSSSRAIFHPSM